jgi:hypothetical protein
LAINRQDHYMDEQQIKDRVEETLQAFEKDVPPPLDPWFFERMVNRIALPKMEDRQNNDFIIGRVLRSGLLTGLAALNILVVVWMLDANASDTVGRDSYIESLTSQYGLNVTDSYLLSESKE